ncbi:regulatory protein RecX [Microbacterium sp. VKM Ac-2923]|uniref:regulatory protein RecX n=1 Tax=Microbacterium sp. VKM Ac-2923 TaxID=2929476 RepID=UPI001FB2B409|nr:regulatory protein RecX [Microbacterium sp. VKM Ac-2923]MCJ1708103.1 RecX family transcriptional regulator [Microbacterium sp. VKM Ac-2923]
MSAAKRPRLRPLRNIDATVDGSRGGDSVGEAVAIPADGLDEVAATEEARQSAEAVLLRKLRSRSLSISEARGVVRGVEGADDLLVEEIIDRFVDLGYLDDAIFAEQLAMSAVEKRGEGRRAVAETLRKRGIPRDIAEVALAALPDDDAERALEFARSKVRGVEGVEYEAALRRLGGQLARRGYPSSVALTAARAALQEAGIGRSRSFARPASGVRFSPDE